MAKTKEELQQLKEEYESLATKLNDLSEEELKEVCVGVNIWDIATKNKDRFNAKMPEKNPDEKYVL